MVLRNGDSTIRRIYLSEINMSRGILESVGDQSCPNWPPCGVNRVLYKPDYKSGAILSLDNRRLLFYQHHAALVESRPSRVAGILPLNYTDSKLCVGCQQFMHLGHFDLLC
jgi:hypothetical protein